MPLSSGKSSKEWASSGRSERLSQSLQAAMHEAELFSQSAYALMSAWQFALAALVHPSRHVSSESHVHASIQLTMVAQEDVTAS